MNVITGVVRVSFMQPTTVWKSRLWPIIFYGIRRKRREAQVQMLTSQRIRGFLYNQLETFELEAYC